MTKKEDIIWKYAVRLDKQRFRCNFCGNDFSGGATRFKSHLSGIKGRGVEICTKVPRNVQSEAAATINGVHKRPKTEAFSSNSDENSSEVCDKNGSSGLDSLLAKFFLLNNIDYGVVKSPSFVNFVNDLVGFGPGYNLPSRSTLKNVLIPNELGEIKANVSKVKQSWGETGCSLISDIWCDEKENRSLIIIIACSWEGAVLLNTFEIPKDKLTSEFLNVIISFSVQKVGAHNVVQYINGAQGVGPAQSLLAKDYPHICVTRCAAAEIQSLFEEVCREIEWVRVAFDYAKQVVSHIYGDSNILSLMRNYTKNKELRQPQLREFSSNYDMLLSIVEVRSELLQLVQSSEWLSFSYNMQESGKEVTKMIRSSGFWNQVQEAVLALESLCVVLYLLDRYGSYPGDLYRAIEIAAGKIERIYANNPTKYLRLWEIFNSWKGRIIHPIHTAAAFLNSAYMLNEMFRETVKVTDVMDFMERHLVAEEDKAAFVEQMILYDRMKPELFSYSEKTLSRKFHPRIWWDYYGYKLPVLKKYAIQILSQPCSSLVCKRSLTALESAQMKHRQRFVLEGPYDNLSLRMNMILAAKYSARDTSYSPIDLEELDMQKLADRSFFNDLLDRAGGTHLDLQLCHRFGFSSEQYPNQTNLQLQFITRISYSQVTGQEIKGEHGSSIHVFLVDPETGDVVQDNRFLVLQLRLSALEGDFGEEDSNDWTSADFEENEIKDVSLMTGDLEVTLEKGIGTLGSVTFNNDSSITRSGKFRIGVKNSTGDGEGIRIRKGISNAFVVKCIEVTRMHDAAANSTRQQGDSQPASNMDELPLLFSPTADILYGDTGFYYSYFNSTGNDGLLYKHKQRVSAKIGKGAVRWLKLKAILQWAILRRLVARKRAQRMVVYTLALKRLEEWSKGAMWISDEQSRCLLGLQGSGKHDWRCISEKYVISKAPMQVESHAKKYFDYESRLEINKKEDMRVQQELLEKEEEEQIKPLDAGVGDSIEFPRPDVSQMGCSLALFSSLLNGNNAEPTEDEVSERGGDEMVLEQSESMKSTNSNAGRSAPQSLDRSGCNPLALFPELLTEHGDETAEEFTVVAEPGPMLSTRPAEVDELNDKSTCSSAEQMHHLTANVTHLDKCSTCSSIMDWEMISWSPAQMLDHGTGQCQYDNKCHKISLGNEQQLSDKSRRTETQWLTPFAPTASGRAKRKVGSQLEEDGEQAKVDQNSVISGGEPGSCHWSLDVLCLTSKEHSVLKLGSLSSPKHLKISTEPLRMKTIRTEGGSGSSYLKHDCHFSLRDLEIATNEFSQENDVGEGDFGIIYQGKLTNGLAVAVIKLIDNSLSEEEFRANVEARTRLRHENLVQLLGYCSEETNRLLVYEYISCGNLDQLLHGPLHLQKYLTWEARMKIGLDVAKALSYLLEETQPRVVHWNIRCSNILVDEEFNAKISDLRITRFLDSGKSHVMTRLLDGNFLCTDPENASSDPLNVKSDIYSFGVVLIKVIMGRDPLDYDHSSHEVNLVDWLKTMVKSGQSEQLVDPNIETRPSTRALERALLIALRCLDPDAYKRPKMSEVVRMLESGEIRNLQEDQQPHQQTSEIETDPPMVDLSIQAVPAQPRASLSAFLKRQAQRPRDSELLDPSIVLKPDQASQFDGNPHRQTLVD